MVDATHCDGNNLAKNANSRSRLSRYVVTHRTIVDGPRRKEPNQLSSLVIFDSIVVVIVPINAANHDDPLHS